MPTGNFQIDLTSASGNAIVECLNVRNILRTELAEYKNDYFSIIGEFVIELCDIATNITTLASAPIADIDTLEDSKSQQAAKIHSIWSNYPKAGIQLYLDTGNGIWRKQGQPIVIQNKPFQLPIGILKPYLSSSNNFKLLSKSGRLGAQIITSPGWVQLGIGDEISIKGDWRFTVTFQEKVSKPINNWFPINENLTVGTAKAIRPANNNRRSLVLTNDGVGKIYIYFGDESLVNQLTGIALQPGDTMSFMESQSYIPNKISAIAVDENSRLIGMEGTI